MLSNLPRAFQSFCPVRYCLNQSNQIYVEETEDKKFSDKKKASEVIEVVFEKFDKSRYVSVE